MAIKISALPAAAAITGTELTPIVQGGVTVQTTAFSRAKSAYVDPRDYGTFDPTGVAASDVALNAAVVAAQSQRLPLIIPPGVFLLNNMINLTPSSTGGLYMLGAGGLYGQPGGPIGSFSSYPANTTFIANFNNQPAFCVNNGRGIVLKDFAVIGQNYASGLISSMPPNNDQHNYVTTGCRTSVTSPYCGLAVDSFCVASGSLSDGGYPTLTSLYGIAGGTSEMLVENVWIEYFVVGICHALYGSIGDTTTYRKCFSGYHDTAWACGTTQAKIVTIEGGQYGGRTVFDGVTYGLAASTGASVPPKIVGPIEVGGYRLFNFNTGYGPFSMKDAYAESLRSIGNYGTNTSAANYAVETDALTLDGCSFYLQAGTSGIGETYGLLPPITLETQGACSYTGNTISIQGSGGTSPRAINFCAGGLDNSSPICARANNWPGSANLGQPPFIGWNATGLNNLSIKHDVSTIVQDQSQPYMLDEYGASIPQIMGTYGYQRFTCTGKAALYYWNGAMYQYVPATSTGLYSATVSALTMNTTAITFTAGFSAGATTGTLTGNWTGQTSFYNITFSDAEVRLAFLINGSTAVTWYNYALTGTPTASATVGNTSVTFTTSDVSVLVGDTILWQMLAQGGSPITQVVPALTVSNVSGAGPYTVTCQFLWQATEYDTVAHQPSSTTLKIPQTQWAPSVSLTASMNNSTALTSVSPTSILQNGDWVISANIPANTRVVSGGNTASVTLNKATTGGSLTAQVMYFGRLNAVSMGSALA